VAAVVHPDSVLWVIVVNEDRVELFVVQVVYSLDIHRN